MGRILSVIAVGILLLCVFHAQVGAALGVSPFVLIGCLACLAIGCVWAAPLLEAADKADWRYEKRLVRRPGV